VRPGYTFVAPTEVTYGQLAGYEGLKIVAFGPKHPDVSETPLSPLEEMIETPWRPSFRNLMFYK
jgi:hypothetical protein